MDVSKVTTLNKVYKKYGLDMSTAKPGDLQAAYNKRQVRKLNQKLNPSTPTKRSVGLKGLV